MNNAHIVGNQPLLSDLRLFHDAARRSSFVATAAELGASPTFVSKRIAILEKTLGVTLFKRTTRRVAITEQGEAVDQWALKIIAAADGLAESLRGARAEPSGLLRIAADPGFGRTRLAPLLAEFSQRHPALEISLQLAERPVDRCADEIDIDIRVGEFDDAQPNAQRLVECRRVVCAAPAYLERHGTPRSVDDLAQHNCLGFNFRRAAPVWPIRESGRIVDRAVKGALLANNGETVRHMALAGVGLARMGDYHVRADLAAGRLVEVLADVIEPDEEQIHAVFLGGTHMPQRVRAFLDYVAPRLQRYLSADD